MAEKEVRQAHPLESICRGATHKEADQEPRGNGVGARGDEREAPEDFPERGSGVRAEKGRGVSRETDGRKHK